MKKLIALCLIAIVISQCEKENDNAKSAKDCISRTFSDEEKKNGKIHCCYYYYEDKDGKEQGCAHYDKEEYTARDEMIKEYNVDPDVVKFELDCGEKDSESSISSILKIKILLFSLLVLHF